MAKRNVKFPSKSRKSALRVEALEQRQLLAAVTGGGTEVGSNIVHPNGNVYDQVLMTGSSVTVGADASQVTRVSFTDLSGDIVQAEFSGSGTLTVSLADFSAKAPASGYNQPGVEYVKGNASFIIQGSDATTNFSVFSVGPGNAVNQDLFAGGKTGGDNIANVQAIQIVSNPQNPGGFSNFGGIYAGNAVFSAASGTVGIAAANVNVQGPVIIGDLDATNAGVPTLNFGANSQFSSLTVAGGDLVQSNGAQINGGNTAGLTSLNFTSGATSAISSGSNITAKINSNADLFTGAEPTSTTLDTATSFTLTGATQTEINNFFTGRTFTNDVTLTGNLATGFNISAVEFRGKVTITGDAAGTLSTTSTQAGKGFSGGLEVTGNLSNTVTTNSLASLKVGGALSSTVTVNAVGGAGGALGTTTLGSIAEGKIIASSIGNVSVTGNVTGDGGNASYVLRTTGATSTNIGNIGTVTVAGDVNLDAATDRLILVDGTGTFGNVTIGGAGTLGGTGTVAALNLGVIQVDDFGVGQTTTGTITINETVSANFGGAVIGGGAVVGSGKLSDITITGGGATGATLTLSGRIGAEGIGTDLIEVGNLTVTGFNDVVLNATAAGALIGGSKAGNISVTTTAGTTSQVSSITVTDFVSLDDGSASTGEVLGNVTLNADQTAGNFLAVNAFNTFAQYDKGASIGTVTLNGKTVTVTADIHAATIGAVSATGATTFDTNVGIKSTASVASLTVTGNLTLGATGVEQAAVAGATLTTVDANIQVKDIGAINVTGNLAVGAGNGAAIAASGTVTSLNVGGTAGFNSTNASNIQVKAIGDVSVTGVTTFANSTFATIRANDGTSGLDTIGNITLARVIGAAGTEIQGSSVGNVNITAKLIEGQALVNGLDIIAAPNAQNTLGTAALNLAASEQVALDGSNLSSYKIGTVTVASQLDLAYTGTILFDGDNSFVALGSIGEVKVTGATAGAQQSRLFESVNDAAWFVAGDVDGLLNDTANMPGNFNLGTTTSGNAANFTGGTVSIGAVTVNALQTLTANNYSGVNAVSGSDAAAAGTIEGLAVLSGVRAATGSAGMTGDVITTSAVAGSSTVNMHKIDSDLKGTIGNILVASNNAVALRGLVTGGTVTYPVAGQAGAMSVITGGAADLMSGIVAATSTGTVQGGASISSSAADKIVILGDTDGVADTIVEDASAVDQIVVVVL